MAFAFDALVLDGLYTKIVDVHALDNDAAGPLALAFVADCGCAAALPSAPLDYKLERITSPDTANSFFTVTAADANGFTLRKNTTGGGANNIKIRCIFRVVHSIDR